MSDNEIGNAALIGLWVSVIVVSVGFLLRSVWDVLRGNDG